MMKKQEQQFSYQVSLKSMTPNCTYTTFIAQYQTEVVEGQGTRKAKKKIKKKGHRALLNESSLANECSWPPVWPDLAKFRHKQNVKSHCQFFEGFISIWQNFANVLSNWANLPYCKSPTMGRPKNIFFKKDAPNQSVTARDSQWLEAVNFNRIWWEGVGEGRAHLPTTTIAAKNVFYRPMDQIGRFVRTTCRPIFFK